MTIISLLGSSQTFIGVISTIAILCMFLTHKEGNFISLLLIDIKDNTIDAINKYANSIKEKIYNRKGKLYKKSEIDFGEEPPESYLNKKAPDKNRFAALIGDLKFLTNKALSTAEDIELLNEERKKNIELDYSKRKESQLLALLVFMSSIFLLMLDSMSICLQYLIPFSYFFMSYILVYSIIMWINYFSNRPNRVIKEHKHKYIFSIIRIVCFISASFLLLILLHVQEQYFFNTVVFAISTYMVFIFIVAFNMFNRYMYCHNYPITIVLRHFMYFIFMSVISTMMLNCFIKEGNELFIQNISWLYSVQSVRSILIIIFILDIVFVPLFGGYLYLKKGEFKIRKKYKKSEKDIDKKLDDIIEELHLVICKVKENDEELKNQSKT